MTKHAARMTIAVGLLALLHAPTLFAQDQQPAPPAQRGPQRGAGLPAGEVERLFESYVAMQAQDALKLTDDQLPQFLARLKSLQQARRRHNVERRRLVASLNELLQAQPFKEAEARDTIRKIRDLDARAAEDILKAYDGVDQVLDVAQQARFRVFEESVERRKFDLMFRARRAAQQKQ